MSRYTGLIQAFDKFAEASAKVALELEALDAPAAVAPPSAASASGAGSPERPSAPATHAAVVDEGECPKHHREWKIGKYGPFCSQPTDDPAWGKERGDKTWCTITPANAPKWLEIHGTAA